MKNILFRVDSSSSIGTGHIMRDLVLAKQFEGSEIIFATQNLPGNINHKIVEAKFKVEILDSNNLTEVVALVKKYSIDMVVIDNYEIDYLYEEELKSETGVKILVLDDIYEKHCCDILLNHNVYADKMHYKGLVPESCEFRCGSEFTLLREEFIREKKDGATSSGKNKQNVFVVMGGADHANKNLLILKSLEPYVNLSINIVTTSANQYLGALEEYVKTRSNVILHINSSKIARLLGSSDFAIVTPSVTVNEVLYLEVPFVAIKTADNQKEMYRYLIENDYLALENFSEVELQRAVEVLING